MRISHRNGVPVYPISTGQNWGYGTAMPVENGCVIIDLSALKQIVHFDAELGVVTVEPGVTQGMLADFLDAGGHSFLVPVTGAGPTCSLLGNALERGYGVTPHADHFGAVTDLEAVLADGSMYRTALCELGGADLARLFKWGIGPYSVGLFTQAGFGVVTRLTIVLARRPESIKVCLFSLRDDELLEPAVARIRHVLSLLPGTVGGLNLMNRHRVLAMSAPYPAERVGADGMIPSEVISQLGREYQVLPWTGFGTLYGTRGVIAAAQKEMRSALKGVASRLLFLSPGHARTLSRVASAIPGRAAGRFASTAATLAQSLQLVAGRPNETALPLAYWRNNRPNQETWRNPSRDGSGLTWYAPLVPMRPANVRAYVDMVKRVVPRHGIEPLLTLTSLNDRLFDSTVPLLFDRQDPTACASAARCYDELLAAGRQIGAYPYRLGVGAMAKVMRSQIDAGRFHHRIRQSLDADNLLSPGRYNSDVA
ncbi:FAD-binding oxidoreductase [soil metagenome]